MAYTEPLNLSAGDTLSATNYGYIRTDIIESALAIVTTKGDIVSATGSQALARLAVGADDSTLVADSGESTGLAWQIQPAVHVYNSAALDPTVDDWTIITYDNERFDTDAMHSTSSNTSRLTVPANGDGIYLLGCCVEFEANDSGNPLPRLGVRLLLNGSTVIAKVEDRTYEPGTTAQLTYSLRCLYSLSATDYVELQVYTTEDVNVQASGNYSPEFWAIWQRRA